MNPVAGRSPALSINNNSGNVRDSFNSVWNNYYISVSDRKRQVLEWLSPLTSRERHQAVRDARVDGVGDWLLRTKSFSTWCAEEVGAAKPVLLCYGDPGVGKTYISSLVIDTLSDVTGKDNAAAAYVYCDFSTQNLQSAKTVLASILRQVVGALEKIPDEVQKAFEHAKRQVGGCGLRLLEIIKMLIASLLCVRKGFICIDALDEFPTKHRAELWGSLRQVIGQCPDCRIFLTGRPQIATEAASCFPANAEMVIIKPDLGDIGRYIEKRLEEDLYLNAMDAELRADILRVVPEKVSEIFLLVCINMDAILAEVTIHQRRQVLHRMARGLGLQDAYNTTLDRIRQQGGSKSKLGIKALMWISHSKRPFTPEELCHALGVELGEGDFNTQNVPSIQTVLACTLGLVTLDKKASTVRLLHLTLQDYLREHPTLFETAHSMIAEICLTYLNTRAVRALPPNPNRAWLAPPFLEYATCFWGTHASVGVTKAVEYLALRLLEGYESHVSAVILWRGRIRECPGDKDVQRISGLHCIAFWGIAEIASVMLEVKRWDMNGQDSEGDTPLSWAVKYGNYRLAELLLDQGDIPLNKPIRGGRTVFSFAAEWGSKRIVKLLLERGDVNPELAAEDGRTPLSYAAEYGREGVVKLLLERGDVNPDSADEDGRTPLSYAAEYEREGVVKLLLEREDVDRNSVDQNGRTPLFYAVPELDCEHNGIAELLLACGDVNPDISDNDGQTPLVFAVLAGQEEVVKLLLARDDVDPNAMDRYGLTPLLYAVAADWDSEGIVEFLLQRGDVNPSLSRSNGQTPLSIAAQDGQEEVVKLLLARDDVKPNLSDRDARTPLYFAASRGHKGAAKLLLENADVKPNLLDRYGQTPLFAAIVQEKEDVVQLLLERMDVDPNLPDCDAETPLLYAARCGYERVVQQLLGHRDVDPNIPERRSETPLSYATRSGHEHVVQLLLGHRDVNPNSSDNGGQTSLSFAACYGQEEVVKLLLEHPDINPNLTDNSGQTALFTAIVQEKEDVVKLLLEHQDVDPNLPDCDAETPLLYAARCGYGRVVQILLERWDVDPNLSDRDSETPLSYATRFGHEHVVQLLLGRRDVNPNSAAGNGRTPLSFAAPE